jgi:glycolate oxidase FAD binding subunit
MNEKTHITETIAPADQAAMADVVRDADAKELAVHSLNNAPRLWSRGDAMPRPGIELSLANLNRVIDYPSDDLTITVEAGITMADLSKCLAEKRQRLPIDVPLPGRTTIGEVVDNGTAGPRRYAYGAIRDYLLGFTAVDGTGSVFSGGGRVVKNAAGYNMCRLMAGSRGTLGILTQVTLMVRPQCEASVLLACNVSDFAMAEKLLAGLVISPTRPVAIEFVAGRTDETGDDLGPLPQGNVGRLYVGFEGPEPEVDWMVEQLRADWAAAGASDPMLIPTDRSESLWCWLADFPSEAQINVLPGEVVETMAKLLKIEPDCAIRAHAGDGVIRVLLRGEGREERGERMVSVLSAVSGNNSIILCATCPRPLPLSQWERGDSAGDATAKRRIMQAIKDRFDPKNILNPGQFDFD